MKQNHRLFALTKADIDSIAKQLEGLRAEKALQVTAKIDRNLYEELELNTSKVTPDRPASDDVSDLMHLALETNDREWFDQLAEYKNQLHVIETLARAELGFEI